MSMNWSDTMREIGRTAIFRSLLGAPNGKTLLALRPLPGCGETYGTLPQLFYELQSMIEAGLIYREASRLVSDNVYKAKVTSEEFCKQTGCLPINFK